MGEVLLIAVPLERDFFLNFVHNEISMEIQGVLIYSSGDTSSG